MTTVFISGASQGLGLELARQYAEAGWKVLGTFRDAEGQARLQALGARVEAHRMEVTRLEDVKGLAERLEGIPVDVLIANAGISSAKAELDQAQVDRWMEIFRVNSVGPVLLARAFLPHVLAGGQKKVVAISSLMGSIGENSSGGSIPYRASKAALNSAWKSLSIEWSGRGLAAAVLHPGWVKTRMGGAGAPLHAEEAVSQMRKTIATLQPDRPAPFLRYDGVTLPW